MTPTINHRHIRYRHATREQEAKRGQLEVPVTWHFAAAPPPGAIMGDDNYEKKAKKEK